MRRDVFQAIADPTRRSILAIIASAQVLTPNSIAEKFDSTRQAVSKHIKILTECELLYQEKSGREIYYYLNAVKMREIDNWLEQFRALWEKKFDQLDEILKNMKTTRKKG